MTGLFEPVVEPRTAPFPKILASPAPRRPEPCESAAPARPRRDGGGRHSADAARWGEAGTVPLRLPDLGVRPVPRAGGGQHRRPEPRTRIASLDGLRGVAALVVLVYHVLLTQPALAVPHLDPDAPLDTATWWATFTPLHLLWAGPEAVLVFFVLSGLVLALPVADTGRLNPWDYYPRRLVRLYLPVWAAVGLAVAWAAAFPRVWPAGTSWWIVDNATQPTTGKVLADLLLVWSPGQANHVLWSLQWEVVYSLLLPLVLVAVRAAPRLRPVALLAALAALVGGSALGSLALSAPALFGLGTAMALGHRRLEAWSGGRGRGWWAAVSAAGVGLLLAPWWAHAFARAAGVPLPGVVEDLARSAQGLGAALAVLVAWLWPTAHRALTTSVTQWLGSRSFSLYLVHLPIVASVALVFDGRPPLAAALALTLVVALAVTEVFYRVVERPSHRIARRAGRAVAEWARSAPAAEVVPAPAETGPIRLLPRVPVLHG